MYSVKDCADQIWEVQVGWKVGDPVFKFPYIRVKDIDFAFVEIMQEDIVSFNSQRPLLFVSKYQINPLMKVRADVITLQGLETK